MGSKHTPERRLSAQIPLGGGLTPMTPLTPASASSAAFGRRVRRLLSEVVAVQRPKIDRGQQQGLKAAPERQA